MVEKKLRLLKGNTYNSTEKDAYAKGMRAASRTQNGRAEKGRSNLVIDETIQFHHHAITSPSNKVFKEVSSAQYGMTRLTQ